MNNEELAAEVTRTRDFQEIQNLQAKYGYYIQRGPWADWDGEMCGLFTDDATIEISNAGVFIGKEGVKKVFGKSGVIPGGRKPEYMYVFLQLMPYIKVYDDGTAAATWTCFGYLACAPNEDIVKVGDPTALWIAGRYEMKYAKVSGGWKISQLIFRQHFRSPYELGWCLPQGTKPVNPSASVPDRPTTEHRPYNTAATCREDQMSDPVLPPDTK